jgi:hypothetical protein
MSTYSIENFNRRHKLSHKGRSSHSSAYYWILGISFTILLELALRGAVWLWFSSMSPSEQMRVQNSAMYQMQQNHSMITVGLVKKAYNFAKKEVFPKTNPSEPTSN